VTKSALVAGVRQPRRKSKTQGGVAGAFGEYPNLRPDHDVLDVVRRVAGEVQHVRQGRPPPRLDIQVLKDSAVELQLGDRAQAEADPERGHPDQIALQAGYRVQDVVLVVETALDEDEARTNRFRILGDQRALLRQGGGGARESEGRRQQDRSCSQRAAFQEETGISGSTRAAACRNSGSGFSRRSSR
jgi:hypothetical protein